MRTTEYKVLCQVHVLHDYYLIDSEQGSFFSLDRQAQLDLLSEKLRARHYDIGQDLQFLLSERDLATLRRYKIRFIATALGFFLGMEINSESTAGGEVRYRPFIQPPEDTYIRIGLASRSSFFGSFTNIPLSRADQKIYYFSNQGAPVANTLSLPAPDFSTTTTYRMGDLVRLDGQVQQATESHTGEADKFAPVAGEGFVNESDRRLSLSDDRYKAWAIDLARPTSVPLGWIELYLRTDDENTTLIDDEGLLVTRMDAQDPRPRPPRFELRFLSRSTYWRYRKRGGFTVAEATSLAAKTDEFLQQQDGDFVTKRPQFYARNLLQFEDSLLLLPNARPEGLTVENGRYFSDIYFNQLYPIP